MCSPCKECRNRRFHLMFLCVDMSANCAGCDERAVTTRPRSVFLGPDLYAEKVVECSDSYWCCSGTLLLSLGRVRNIKDTAAVHSFVNLLLSFAVVKHRELENCTL